MSGHNYQYIPNVERSGWLVDQVYCNNQRQFMDHAYDGSPYNIYDHQGNINKAVPLVARPPVNHVFAGFRGTVVPKREGF